MRIISVTAVFKLIYYVRVKLFYYPFSPVLYMLVLNKNKNVVCLCKGKRYNIMYIYVEWLSGTV